MPPLLSKPRAYRKLARRGGPGVPIAVLGVLAASALGAYAVHSKAHAAAFGLNASPSQQAIAAGSPARYRISISRRGFSGAISMSVSGMPREAQPQLTGAGGTTRTLTVITSGRTPTGRYRLLVRARGGAASRTIHLALTITAPKPVPIGISGTVSGLEPGIPQAVDLALRNPGPEVLWVTGLTVTPKSVSAPLATALLPCTLADFSARQFSGIYPLVLPPASTRTLSQLGVLVSQRPQVMLLDRASNQDGCQRATVSLAFAAQGTTL